MTWRWPWRVWRCSIWRSSREVPEGWRRVDRAGKKNAAREPRIRQREVLVLFSRSVSRNRRFVRRFHEPQNI
ncbi:MAG: MbtH family NRPS accessory protein [Verrucomicrobiaceae bacterium]|nr:MAG: MbtH family NRPS accessory protein [Verrucomicrobiaceae bacterium]